VGPLLFDILSILPKEWSLHQTQGSSLITNGTPGTAQVVSGTSVLQGVACPSATTFSATTCEAVGSNSLGQGMVVPITNGSPGTAQAVSGTIYALQGVACPSGTTCEAVGYNSSFQGAVVPVTNGTPGTAQAVSGTSQLFGVACPSATTCEAVGFHLGQGVAVTITQP
jgi:hypothetical protein